MAKHYDEVKLGIKRLQLGGKLREDVDLESARASIKLVPGRWLKVAVEMDHYPDMANGLHLPDKMQEWRMPDRGTVVLAEPETGLSPGDIVVCMPYDGMQCYGDTYGRYKPKGQIRFYGHDGVDFSECVVARMISQTQLEALGRQIIIELDKTPERYVSESGVVLELPDDYKSEQKPITGTIVSVGPDIIERDGVKPGDRVIFSAAHVMLFEYGEIDRCGVIHIDHVFGVIEDAE